MYTVRQQRDFLAKLAAVLPELAARNEWAHVPAPAGSIAMQPIETKYFPGVVKDSDTVALSVEFDVCPRKNVAELLALFEGDGARPYFGLRKVLMTLQPGMWTQSDYDMRLLRTFEINRDFCASVDRLFA